MKGAILLIAMVVLAFVSFVIVEIEDRNTRRIEEVAGKVKAVEVITDWNAGSICRVTLDTEYGQKTIDPYWRDCAKVSNGDYIQAYRIVQRGIGWDWKFR